MANQDNDVLNILEKIELGTHNAGYYTSHDLNSNVNKILYQIKESHDYTRDARNVIVNHQNDLSQNILPKLEKIRSNQDDLKRVLTDIARTLQSIDRKMK